MNRDDAQLDRLLRAAGKVTEESSINPPYGFDTRVVAVWRANKSNGGNGVGRLLRRVAIVATAVLVIASAASVRELRKAADTFEPTSNEFAIADTAIDNEFDQ